MKMMTTIDIRGMV